MVAPNQIFDQSLIDLFRDIEARTRPELCFVVWPESRDITDIADSGAPTEESSQEEVSFETSCRISPFRMGQETTNVQTAQAIGMYWIALPWDINTQAGRVVNEDCTIQFHGATYQIIEVKEPRTINTKTRCLCKKIK